MGHTYQDSTKATTKLSWVNRNKAVLLGCFFVSAWTLIRLFNHSPNFDQLGQQVLAHQWLHGLHSGSVIGPTNYVLKMLFLYMPLDASPLPGQFKLVLMTLLVNVLTFILLVYILKRIWLEFYPSLKDSFYVPLLYLALISGSVYWISFSNSRNLEVVGGLFLIYFYIKSQKSPSARNYIVLILLGGFLFFADPLQIYMTMLPALIFIGLRWTASRKTQRFTILLRLFGCALLSVVLAHILIKFIEAVWNVSFINSSRSFIFSLSSIKSAIEQVAKLYAGGYEGGRLREAVNLMVLTGGIFGAAYYAWRQPKSRPLLSLITIVWVTDLGVYIVSGQAQQLDTHRYLIMTVPMFILALAVCLYYSSAKKNSSYIVGVVLVLNIITLGSAFANAWNPGFSNNDHSRAAVNYLQDHKYSYGYASIGTAISANYLSNWKVNVLPLGCEPDYTLKKTNLFFDKAAFDIANKPNALLIPIVLDGNSIKINDAACGADEIKKQLGTAQKTSNLSDGSTVLLYSSTQLKQLR